MKTNFFALLSLLMIAQASFAQCTLSGLEPSYCRYPQVVPLTGTPPGGFFTGEGVVNSNFYPSSSGLPSVTTVTYTLPYILDQTGTFAPQTLTAPTMVNLADNAYSPQINLPFLFPFGEDGYVTFYISSNGYIHFGQPLSTGCCSGQLIPSYSDPYNIIAFAWEDLDPSLGGTISYSEEGVAPNRKMIIEFNNIQHAGGGFPVTSQVHLYESGLIEIHTTSMPSDGGIHSMGVEVNSFVWGLPVPGRNATSWSATNDYVAFIPGCTVSQNVTMITDTEAPVMVCPSDTTVYLAQGECYTNDFGAPACGYDLEVPLINQSSNNFEGGHASNTTWPFVSADNFSVPVGDCWEIERISANFIHHPQPFGPSFTVNIYSDNAGHPGTLLHSFLNPSTGVQTVGTYMSMTVDKYIFYLNSPINLCTGEYWISFQVNNSDVQDNFYWEYSTLGTSGNDGVMASTSAGPWTPANVDYVFSLSGLMPSVSDNCSSCNDYNLSITYPSGNSAFGAGIHNVVIQAEDFYHNTSTCSFTLTVIDTIPPIPMDQTLDDIVSECTVTSIPFAMAYDCMGYMTVMSTPDVYPPYEASTTITWTHTDYHGNSMTQTQNIIINDVTDPLPNTANLPDIIAECEVTSITAPSATDNCSGAITGVPDLVPPFTDQGTVVITWTFTDDSGNSSAQTQNVIIEDISEPVPDIPSLPDLTGQCEVTSVPVARATDNCQGPIFGVPDVIPPFNVQGTTIITWTFTDQYGNSSTQTQNVVIEDITGPTPNLNTLATIVGTCEVGSLPQPSATDNCGGSVAVFNNAVLPISDAGFTTVTWLYIDQYGNISTQNQSVEILPLELPILDYNGSTMSIQNSFVDVNYQWINCDNGNAPVNGEINPTFVPETEGNYAVVVTVAGCSVTSDCLFAAGANVKDLVSSEIRIFPNPATSEINLKTISSGKIYLYDVSGKLIMTQEVEAGLTVLNVTSLSNGSYTLHFSSEQQVGNVRLIIDRN